jgi:hypothetical protein
MKFRISALFIFVISFASAQNIVSPSKEISVNFSLNNNKPTYSVNYKGKPVINQSELGFKLKNQPALDNDFVVSDTKTSTFNNEWKPVLGEVAVIKNNYNELRISLLQKSTKVKMDIVFRVFNEGVGFRYEFPKQENLNYFIVTDEETQFNLTGDHKAFWIPGDYDSQEYVFNETLLSKVDNDKLNLNNGIALKTVGGRFTIQSPLMLKSKDGLYINIFEAALINYPVMHLDLNTKNFGLKAHLVPNAIGDMAYLQAPFTTPWRTIMVSDDARTIVEQKMVLNLNEPSKIPDVSWIKPMKYIGIWWEMHVGKTSWDYKGSQNAQNQQSGAAINVPHGATTENTKRYIDFAKKHGFDGVLVEGWNTGWEDWNGNWKEEVFDFVTPYPDFDIKAISEYATQQGVKMIMHHETSGSVASYERQMDRAFNNMVKYNYPAVKTGYVGRIIPRGEYHDGQTMVNHFNYVPKRAADFKLMVNSHESSRPTGVHRTWPNYIAAEAARGNEFNGWSSGNPPAHETILPFTRLLGGPMDYTPGIFEIKMNVYKPGSDEQVHTTLAKQLALYVTLYSPLQMAADLPENYEKYMDAFQFIKDVAVDWQDTKVLEAEPGDYITIARKAKGSENWFLGAITDENARESKVSLNFLTPGKKYKAVIYQDGKNADWKNNPKSYQIKTQTVTAKSSLALKLAPGGGTAVSFFPIN